MGRNQKAWNKETPRHHRSKIPGESLLLTEMHSNRTIALLGSPGPRWLHPAIVSLSLYLGTLWLFWPSTRNGFVWDDAQYIIDNAHLRDGLSITSINWAFTSFYAANWHPLTWISHLIDVQLFGLVPWGHHITNILLHAANTMLLFLTLRSLTGRSWRSALVAIVFAVHPLRLESVAWISERKDVLSLFFGLGTIWSYSNWVRRHTLAGWIQLHALYLLALLAKPMLVTLPFVLLLLDEWPLQRIQVESARNRIDLLREKTSLFALAVLSSVVTVLAQASSGGLLGFARYPISSRLGNTALSYVKYLSNLLLPSQLEVFYPYPLPGIAFWKIALACLLVLTITGCAWKFRNQHPYITIGWYWYLVTLLPVIGIIQNGQQSMADRYTYFPMIGPVFACVWFITQTTRGFRLNLVFLVAATASIIALGWETRAQIPNWANDYTLFSNCLRVDPDNWLAHAKVGVYVASSGRTSEGIFHFKEALRLNPDHQPALVNLTSAYNDLGNQLINQQKPEQAIGYYREAIKLRPMDADAYANLGFALESTQRFREAIDEYQRASFLDPSNPRIRNNLGSSQLKSGMISESIASFQESLRLAPNQAQVHVNLALALTRAGRLSLAINHYRNAIKLQPGMTSAHSGLQLALRTQSEGLERKNESGR